MKFPLTLKHPESNRPILCIAPNVTGDGCTWYGVKWIEIQKRAAKWWDGPGRRELWRVRGDMTHQDTGVDSAILRGEPWEQLDGRERAAVTSTYEASHVRREPEHAEFLREFMIHNFPEELDQAELARHLAAAPDASEYTDALLEARIDAPQSDPTTH